MNIVLSNNYMHEEVVAGVCVLIRKLLSVTQEKGISQTRWLGYLSVNSLALDELMLS